MPNIEIKAKCLNLDTAREIVKELKTDYIGELHQVDTYFSTIKGRLKLREINGEIAQLIPYYKEYSKGPMKSNYSVLDVKDVSQTKSILNEILGTITVVDKQRKVFLINNIRVHLDDVKALGSFIELEAVYEDENKKDQEVQKVAELLKIFRIKDEDLLDKSYIDYLLV